jgi:hypothetical protein
VTEKVQQKSMQQLLYGAGLDSHVFRAEECPRCAAPRGQQCVSPLGVPLFHCHVERAELVRKRAA